MIRDRRHDGPHFFAPAYGRRLCSKASRAVFKRVQRGPWFKLTWKNLSPGDWRRCANNRSALQLIYTTAATAASLPQCAAEGPSRRRRGLLSTNPAGRARAPTFPHPRGPLMPWVP